MYEVILKRFENLDEVRTFEKGKFEIVRLGGMTIGRATYEPGWKWSVHVGKAAWLSPAPLRRQWTTAVSLKCGPGTSSTLHPVMTAGSWERNRTSPCILWEQVTTPNKK